MLILYSLFIIFLAIIFVIISFFIIYECITKDSYDKELKPIIKILKNINYEKIISFDEKNTYNFSNYEGKSYSLLYEIKENIKLYIYIQIPLKKEITVHNSSVAIYIKENINDKTITNVIADTSSLNKGKTIFIYTEERERLFNLINKIYENFCKRERSNIIKKIL